MTWELPKASLLGRRPSPIILDAIWANWKLNIHICIVVLFDVIKNWWNIMIDNWDVLVQVVLWTRTAAALLPLDPKSVWSSVRIQQAYPFMSMMLRQHKSDYCSISYIHLVSDIVVYNVHTVSCIMNESNVTINLTAHGCLYIFI